MYAFNISTKKKGRPYKFVSDNSFLNTKKQALFESNEDCKSEQMNLINLAYQTNKIDKEERDIASFLESLFAKLQKHLNLKKLPSSAPHTWNIRIKSIWQSIQHENEKASYTWNSIKSHLEEAEPEIAQTFFKLICTHHSYEELMAIKLNFAAMDILKTALQELKQAFDNHLI